MMTFPFKKSSKKALVFIQLKREGKRKRIRREGEREEIKNRDTSCQHDH